MKKNWRNIMTISNDVEAKILRYFHVEKWRVGTIARQLHVHRSVVQRVLSAAGIPKANFIKRESLITPYLSFITETLTKYPKLTAARLYEMVHQRGYPGGADHFRHMIGLYRPRPFAEAYLRLRTLPGEQAQVDWGHFGYVNIGKARRPLMAFVMVLSYSRKIFLRFYLNQQTANFLRGHEAAFIEYQGVPRVLLYDNLRSAVLERQGDAIRFNPVLLEFAAHYRYEPRPVAVARGNEKGRVERAIRYVRDNFFAARTWQNIDDLNQQAMVWCNGIAAQRPCPEDKTLSVKEAFLQEQPKLLMLPDNPYPTHEREEVRIGKTPYARFDLNDYSLPHTHVRRTVTVCATLSSVSILEGAKVVATHPRSFDKGQQVEDEKHIADLTASKRKARKHRGQDRLRMAAPASQMLLIQAAERGYNIGSIVAQLLQLLNDYGASDLNAAIDVALSKGVPHPNAVRISLEKQREERHLPPPISVTLPDDRRVHELVIRPHQLESYDQLIKEENQ
jgi:transposase